MKELFHDSLLVDASVAEPRQLLLQGVEVENEIVDVLTRLESQVLPLLKQVLKCRPTGAIAVDACGGDGVPGVLGGPLVRNGGLHRR